MITNITSAAKKTASFPVRAAHKLWRLAVDRAYRNMMWLHFAHPAGAFQPFNDTSHNRYPHIFSFVQSVLGRGSAVNVLSYGCSTGEEAFSLREYFLNATIKGVDIHAVNISVGRRRLSK